VKVQSGGTASGTIVSSGGTLDVFSGGLADPTTILSGGSETVSAHGTDDGAKISGGTQLDYGLASGAMVFTGAQVIESGGTASGTTVSSGGTLDVLSGGNAGGITVNAGATAVISKGGVGFGLILASGSGAVIELDGGTISGGTLKTSGAGVIEAVSASTNVISGATIGSGTIVETTSGAMLSAIGTVANSGTLFASGTGSTVDIVGVVNGGVAEVGNGIVDIKGTSGENVSFQSGGSGGLRLDDALAGTYTGKVSGFGENTKQFIDLTQINSAGATLSYTSANPSNTSGTLTVATGGVSATITMVGTYRLASFTLGHDAGGHVEITDPPLVEQQPGDAPAAIAADTGLEVNTPDSGRVTFGGTGGTLWFDQPASFIGTVKGFGATDGIDLPGIGFGANTTLGYSENSSQTGGALMVSDGAHSANVALLRNYMAASFVTAADGHGGTLVTEASQTANQQPLLTHPHA
jgi:autotransporter passenger strand-loop-strand repeat protein